MAGGAVESRGLAGDGAGYGESLLEILPSRRGPKCPYVSSALRVALYGYRARDPVGVQWLQRERGRREAGRQTGRHVSLRVIKVGPRYGGSCTAPVATKAPHHEPSLSPLTLSHPGPLRARSRPISALHDRPSRCSRRRRYGRSKAATVSNRYRGTIQTDPAGRIDGVFLDTFTFIVYCILRF